MARMPLRATLTANALAAVALAPRAAGAADGAAARGKYLVSVIS